MALTPGARLGAYEILGLLGAGGMGEVYKARDTRLDRSVAIKVLRASVATDPERRHRFEQEARAVSALNHPHICVLHDIGRAGETDFLVMEYLDGQTLAERLAKGPLPLEQALSVATDIADALAAAHKQGIVHRDLKPGNVMLTKAGAKLLDFGLARLTQGSGATGDSRTVTDETIPKGTVPYMAPEQVEGRPVDARTDLFAFGAVVYEMLTGRRAFDGASAASIISAILSSQPPPLSSVQPLTPPALDRLVRRCLAKDPEERWDTAHDVADELRWMRETSGKGTLTGVRRRRRFLRVALEVAGGLLLFVAGVGVMWLLRPVPPRASVAHVSLDVRPAEELHGIFEYTGATPGGYPTGLTWTPDGQALVFVGRRAGVQRLYVRPLDAAEARPLPGTEGADLLAVSPDGRYVAFWARTAIRKVPVGGGPVMTLVSGLTVPPWGLAWDARGGLFYGGEAQPIWHIPAGGTPAAVTTVAAGEVSHGLPWALPGERALLYTVRKRGWSWGDEEVVAQTLATGVRKVLLRDAADARYVPSGHLVFLRRGQLFAVPFDAERLEVRGTPQAVLDEVAQGLTAGDTRDITGAGQFAIAATGTLAWVPSPVVPYADAALVTVDRSGHVSPLPAPMQSYGPAVRVSPDGRRLAVTIRTLTEVGFWVYDLGRGRLDFVAGDGEVEWPVWFPDGRRLLFDWLADGRPSLASKAANAVDAATAPQVLLPGLFVPSSFTPDGRRVAAVKYLFDIVLVTVEDGQARVQPLIQTPHTERWPEFSPDGRWLVYGSNVSGRFEVYVRPYPGLGTTDAVSLEGGYCPAWHPSGRELFFLSRNDPPGKRRMMAVDFAPGAPPRFGRPRVLFEFDQPNLIFFCAPVRCYDVAPDGQRFYVVQSRPAPPPPAVTHINLIQNWVEELKAKVPTPR